MTGFYDRLLVAVILCLYSHSAFSARKSACRQLDELIARSRALKELDSFWSKDQAITVATPSGANVPLTFSFDAETSAGQLLFNAFKDPVAKRAILQLMPRLSRAKLTSIFNYSDQQLGMFVLRRDSGVNPGARSFDLSDLNAASLSRMLPSSSDLVVFAGDSSIAETVRDICQTSFDRNALPLLVMDEEYGVEIKHTSFESIPLQFAGLVAYMEQNFLGFHMHLHIGVSTKIADQATLSVARALDAKVTLDLATWPTEGREIVRYNSVDNFESFKKWPDKWGKRGFVSLKPKAFGDAHDLELRQYNGLSEGMNLIAQASRLLTASDRLIIEPKRKFGSGVKDEFNGTVDGALEYVAFLLGKSKSRDLKALSSQVEEARLNYAAALTDPSRGRYTLRGRQALRQFLLDHEITRLLNDDIFLKPER